MRNIWKVGKRKNRQFENVIKLSKHGDVIFLPPGEYHFLDGFNIKNLTIKGLGKVQMMLSSTAFSLYIITLH